MKNIIMQSATSVAQNPKESAGVILATFGTGVATLLEWLPIVVGVLASFAGFVYTVVLIYTVISQHRIKMKIFKRDLTERKARNGRHDRRDDN
ncbi:MAG: hypothetical protein JKX85_00900 [Phycisphaeraceae bacterium]|nr:hypothetical protein [Phycisphaeraceae bacterium]